MLFEKTAVKLEKGNTTTSFLAYNMLKHNLKLIFFYSKYLSKEILLQHTVIQKGTKTPI